MSELVDEIYINLVISVGIFPASSHHQIIKLSINHINVNQWFK